LGGRCHLIEGPVGAAIYDLPNRKVWTVPALIRQVLLDCAGGSPLEVSLRRIPRIAAMPAAYDVIRTFALHHPALRLVSRRGAGLWPLPITRVYEPRALGLEITNGCNLQCRHCYVACGPAPSDNGPPAQPDDRSPLPTARWLDLLEEARALGFESLVLTGGEPTLHPDLALLLRKAHRLRFRPIELLSNLLRLDDALIALLRRIGARVQTSVYADHAEAHDAVTGLAGSFARTIGGIERLLAAGVQTRVNVVSIDHNPAASRRIQAFLTGLGVGPDDVTLGRPVPIGRAADLVENLRRSVRARTFGPLCVRQGKLLVNSCLAGKAAIDTGGDVYACLLERAPLGNVAGAPLRAVIDSPAMQQLWQIRLENIPGCSQCEFRYACADCRGFAHALSGNLLGRDPSCPYNPLTGQWHYEGLEMNEKPRRKDGFIVEEMDGDLLLANFQQSQMHVLNPIAAVIWDMCDGLQTVEAIVDTLAAHFNSPAQDIRRDVDQILAEFRAKGLIE